MMNCVMYHAQDTPTTHFTPSMDGVITEVVAERQHVRRRHVLLREL
jgi:hypothetical protein